MNTIYCMSYSDFGRLLSEDAFCIGVRRLEGYDFPVYENVLTRGETAIYRRFAKVSSVFDDEQDQEESALPSEIRRLVITYSGLEVFVIPSLDFQRLFADSDKNEFGMVLTDSTDALPVYDEETLSEDVVMLASNGVNLNDPSAGDKL